MTQHLGLTSPRHAKHPYRDRITEPIKTWLDDLTKSERVFQTIRALLLLIIAIAVIGTISACHPTETIPGGGYEPSAVVITPLPVPQPATTTWEQVGA